MNSSTEDEILIREVGPESIEAVMKIMTRAFDPDFGEAWNSSQCLGILGLPNIWLVLATRGDTVCGFALGRIVLDEAELLLIATDPDCRETGVGQSLLDFMMRAAHERGATRMHLEVREGNPALRLYERAGFQMMGRRRDYYRGVFGQSFDALTLVRTLGHT